MTRKDYLLISTALKADAAHIGREQAIPGYAGMNDWQKGAYDQWSTTVLAFAAALGSDNAAFDRARFLADAGVQS